ncbi:hypothetical protein [Haloplanus rubicundus]|uniref:Uncharacterized protein n=1 Tax=Haloplanus rubicundus TaxID=1547898 RepID=A0A345ED26_9EURY|nr:hypothetical protein [Haloplanus rubicundus]AXG10098.1 hypothetical protein DU484_09685 [Haloplanus rubicundus]
MGDDIDDLIERLGELDPDERRELSRRMQADWARRVGDAQRAYVERLEEENLVGGGGKVFQPIPGEEEKWTEYCREHPNDPICLAGSPPAVGDRLGDFLDIREEYLSHLEEEGLLDVETASPGGGFRPVARTWGDPSPQPSRGAESPVGLTPPPDPWPWPPQWPPWPWPWPWPGPGPRPGPWGYADNGDPVPLPTVRDSPSDTLQRTPLGGRRPTNAVDPRRLTPGSGAAMSREGLTFPPDEWPPWPWPWPWPGPRPDPFPFGGDPIPFPASRW